MTDLGAQPAKGKRTSRRRPWARPVLAGVLLWLGLAFAGFYYITGYIDMAIQDIQRSNALHIKSMGDKLDSLQHQLEELEWVLANADETLSRSSGSQDELKAKFSLLDEQLGKLEESLHILKESIDGEG
jgi:septal ring factor EnvC (AmiA/AmiB activator)